MRILFGSAVFVSLVLGGTAAAQQSTSLTRSEVTAIRAKLVAVQQAMGADPAGYGMLRRNRVEGDGASGCNITLREGPRHAGRSTC